MASCSKKLTGFVDLVRGRKPMLGPMASMCLKSLGDDLRHRSESIPRSGRTEMYFARRSIVPPTEVRTIDVGSLVDMDPGTSLHIAFAETVSHHGFDLTTLAKPYPEILWVLAPESLDDRRNQLPYLVV